jgi:hypothetical protein
MYDIPNDKVQFFRSVDEYFDFEGNDDQSFTFEDIISIVHPADCKAFCADIDAVRLGKKDIHDMNFRMFKKSGLLSG